MPARTGTRVGTSLHGTQGLALPGADAPKIRLTAGKVVAGTRYRIVRWLGEGGMGVVYEAEHVDIERRVALKILRFDLSQQPKMVEVFRDEARAASRLGSKHLVEIYDFGELADGRLFFAMELLDGRDLVPEEGAAMEPARAIAILRQVCKGLHKAHQAGVVHRDVKPENLIAVRSEGRDDAVKVVDFGISAMLAAGRQEQGTGGVAGTPHYMAPEQILGQAFDGRLDIYALGCTAFELLTGKTPFQGETLEALLHAQLTAPPPSFRDVRSDLQVPAALEAVVMRCLEKDPSRRYADMADLEAALCEAQLAAGIQTFWDDLPIPELPDLERRERLLREMPSPLGAPQPRRRWLWPMVAAVSTLAAVGLAAFLLWGMQPNSDERNVVEELTIAARDAAAKTHWVFPPPDEPTAPTAYRKVLELEDVEGPAESLADERGESLREEFSSTLIAQADRLWDNGAKGLAREWYHWALLFDESNRHARERSGTTVALLADFRARAQEGDFTRAEVILGRLTAAEASEDEGERQRRLDEVRVAIEEEELSPRDELYLRQYAVRSSKRPRSPTPAEASEDAPEEQSEVLADAAPEPEPEPVEELVVDDPSPEADEGATSSKRSKRRRRRRVDPTEMLGEAERDPKKAQDLADQGLQALRSGRRSEASSLFNQAIAYDRRNAEALMGLADIYFDTGADRKAVVYAERAVSAAPGNQHYRIKLGDAYFKVLRYRDALAQYERAAKAGSSKAQSRIAKVREKLGESP